MSNKMTVKELAQVAGVSRYTIRRTANELFPGVAQKGKKAFYDKQQSIDILDVVRKVNMVSVERVQDEHLPVQNAHVDYDSIGKMIGAAITAALSPIVDRLDKISNVKALPDVKQDYYTLVAYRKIKGFNLTFSESCTHGKHLSKLCKERGYEVRKVED